MNIYSLSFRDLNGRHLDAKSAVSGFRVYVRRFLSLSERVQASFLSNLIYSQQNNYGKNN